jgi:DNA-binding FadR family transcriptional regulator
MTETRKLCVFLCQFSQDKPIVRELYQRLNAEGWIEPNKQTEYCYD